MALLPSQICWQSWDLLSLSSVWQATRRANANLTLYLPVDSKMHSLYIIITAGAGGILIILLISVGAVKK
ncbi:hypothetical protein L3Q82_013128, partial [Scortum barcoo]